MTGVLPPVLLKGEVRFHNKTICNFMVYKNGLETNLLQLFAHPQNSELFSISSAIILRSTFLLRKNKLIGNDLFVFYGLPLPSTFLLLPLPYRCSGVPEES